MSEGFVWASYLTTYGLIVGYVAVLYGRLRRRRDDGAE